MPFNAGQNANLSNGICDKEKIIRLTYPTTFLYSTSLNQ